MLDTTRPLFVAALLSFGLAGCQSGPAKVCAKIDDLTAAAVAGGDAKEKAMAEKMQRTASTCVTRMKKMEQDDPAVFAEAATCIDDATALKQVVQCFFKAALGDKAIAPPADPKSTPAPDDAKAGEG